MKKIFIILTLLLSQVVYGQQQIVNLNVNEIRGNDTTQGGCSDYDSVIVRTQGVVYGRNFGQANNRIQFSLIEKRADTLLNNRCGIGLFKANQNLPVTLNEGDSIKVVGLVTCFAGLSQIVIDTVLVLKTNAQLSNPRIVTTLNEVSESYLVKMLNMEFDPATWQNAPTGSGFTAKAFRGVPGTTNYQDFDIRIDNDCDLYGQSVPQGKVDIVGIGGQFDSSIPRDTRYQLLPRNVADITPSPPQELPVISFGSTNYVIDEGGAFNIPINSSVPVTQQIACIVESENISTDSSDYLLQQPNLATFPISSNTANFGFVINSDNQDEPTEIFKLKLKKNSESFNVGADSVATVVITGTLSTKSMSLSETYFYYTNSNMVVKFPNNFLGEVVIYDSFGRLVCRNDVQNVNQELQRIKSRSNGLYRIQLQTSGGRFVKSFLN
jgi:hypothetical protein